jgi:hypothetical protein
MQFVWNSAAQKAAINQMIAIIQRDQTDALAIINADRAAAGNDDLEPIAEFHKGAAARTALPWLSFGAGVAPFDRESQQLRKADFTVSMVLDVGQFDQEMAQDNGIDYARMLDGIIGASWKQTPADWVTALPIDHESVPSNLTAPPAGLSYSWVFVAGIAPGVVTLDGYDKPVFRIVVPVLFSTEDANTFEL